MAIAIPDRPRRPAPSSQNSARSADQQVTSRQQDESGGDRFVFQDAVDAADREAGYEAADRAGALTSPADGGAAEILSATTSDRLLG